MKCKKGKELMITANSFTKIFQHDESARRKIPPAPGTNQTAGFSGYRPLTIKEINKINYFAMSSRLDHKQSAV